QCLLLFFFFLQAEDGIRDRNVTGVQTCALPISFTRLGPEAFVSMMSRVSLLSFSRSTAIRSSRIASAPMPTLRPVTELSPIVSRSEERRVGKECRSRWLRDAAK